MRTPQNISGIHHITAIASSAADNLSFYEEFLGLRLVKQTVNFDDPYTYHLYYGDAQGSPGTILTFFPWENLPQGQPGAGMVSAVAFSILRDSYDFWLQKISAAGIPLFTEERFGDPVIRFSDPHGLPLELIGISSGPSTSHWNDGPIGQRNAIRGFHSSTTTLNRIDEKKRLLVDTLGMTIHAQEDNRYRFMLADREAPGHFYDVLVDPDAPAGRPGGGTVHHIAFRTEDDVSQSSWQARLRQAGYGATDVRDRNYFRSIYFHSPGGVLFEIATDPPGFTVDQAVEELGSSLMLPTQYEPLRSEIEKQLPLLRSKPFHHIFHEPKASEEIDQTIVTLHGTGGTEHDLIGVARDLSPLSAILSPRGQVVESGMNRFFERLALNVFDENDVVRRSNELANFIHAATGTYHLNPENLTALGYSNGANIAAAILLLRPEVFNRAILLRPMLALKNPPTRSLKDKEILILKGQHDTIIPSESTDNLIQVFREARARVTVQTIDAGHEITGRDIDEMTRWYAKSQGMYQPKVHEDVVGNTV